MTSSSNADLIAALAQAQTALQPLFEHLRFALVRVDELERENRALRDDIQHRAAITIQRCFRRWHILHQVRDMVYELGVRRRLKSRRHSTRTLETESSSDEYNNSADLYYESQSAAMSEPRRHLLMELERRISDYVDFEILQNGLRRPSAGLSDDGTVLQGTPRNTLMFSPIEPQAQTRYEETADVGGAGSGSEDDQRSNTSPYPSVLLTPIKDDDGGVHISSSKSKRRFAALFDTIRRSQRALFDRDDDSCNKSG